MAHDRRPDECRIAILVLSVYIRSRGKQRCEAIRIAIFGSQRERHPSVGVLRVYVRAGGDQRLDAVHIGGEHEGSVAGVVLLIHLCAGGNQRFNALRVALICGYSERCIAILSCAFQSAPAASRAVMQSVFAAHMSAVLP